MDEAAQAATPDAYDWRSALGDISDIPPTPGRTRTTTHPLTLALTNPKHRAMAVVVLTHALTSCEGQLDRLSKLLGCSWHVAGRLVDRAGLRSLAGTLRLEHKHPGPTGHGIRRKPRRKS